jgi:predicted nucleic-acid-binding protein
MRAIDTNVLVRLIVRDDMVQVHEAEAWISKGAWVSILAVTECVWVLDSAYHRTASQIADVIDIFLNHQSLTLEEPGLIAAALTLFRTHPKLGFSDCVMLETARKAGHLPLGTFDRRLAKRSGAQTPSSRPTR